MPPWKFVTAEVISTNDGTLASTHVSSLTGEDSTGRRASANNSEAIETSSSATDSSGTEYTKPLRLIYGNEPFNGYSIKTLQKASNEGLDRKGSTQVDHIYEEVSAIKESRLFDHDIMDYYEKYSPTTAKTLIDTLFLPRHKICKQCASLQDSPVYSDRTIYAKKPLRPREVYLQQQNDVIFFKYCPEDGNPTKPFFHDDAQSYMLVYNYFKTNASGILYYHVPYRDIFDPKSALKPRVHPASVNTTGTVNTELYHRFVTNFSKRISSSGTAPMYFRVNHGNILSTIKTVGYNTDLHNWMNYRNDVFRTRGLKQDDGTDLRANRSSLLLLEPLLLMPELTNTSHGKNRISHSEHMKIVKIVIAYTLSFFILTIITFYIVYFT